MIKTDPASRWSVFSGAARTLRCALALIVLNLAMLVPVASAQDNPGCTSAACVSAGPRLVEVNANQSIVLNTLFQALLPGTAVNLTVADWNALAGADVNLNALILQLGTDLGVDPSQVLNTDITLAQFKAALVNVLAADGQTAAANVLQVLPLNVPGLENSTIRLADLLQVNFPQGSLAGIDLDLLDLLTGAVQLFNFDNIATTPTPVTVDTAGLLLPGVANVQLYAQVVEPPVYVCGPEGTQFYSSAVRLKLNADALNGWNLQPVLDAINTLGLGLTNVSLTQSVLKVQVYADVARAEGAITSIDAIAGIVGLEVRPGVAGLYVGTIQDSIFWNRSQVITPAVVDPVALSTLDLTFNVSILGLGLVNVEVPLYVTAEAAATGAPELITTTVSAPFPKTLTLSSGTVSVGTLLTDLLNNLDINVASGNITATLLGLPITVPSQVLSIVNSIVTVVESVLQGQVTTVLGAALGLLLGDVVDPLLGLLGISIGNAVFTVEGIAESCAAMLSLVKDLLPADDPGRFNLSISQEAAVVASATDVGDGGGTTPYASTPGLSYTFAEAAGTGTDLTPYETSWACVDQDGSAVSTGSGASFSIEAPALAATPQAIICTLANRLRTADVAVTKTDGSATYAPGGTTTYTITVTNTGVDAVTGATVTDNLPAGASLSAPWSCTAVSGSCNAATGGTVGDQTLSLMVDLEPDGTATITVPVTFSTDPGAY